MVFIGIGTLCAVLLLCYMYRFTSHNRDRNAQGYLTEKPCWFWLCKQENEYSAEIWICRIFQAFSFTLCYEFANVFGNKGFWEGTDIAAYPFGKAELHAIYLTSLLVLFAAYMFCMLWVITTVCFNLSKPPFMDRDHWTLVQQVVDKSAAIHEFWGTTAQIDRTDSLDEVGGHGLGHGGIAAKMGLSMYSPGVAKTPQHTDSPGKLDTDSDGVPLATIDEDPEMATGDNSRM